MALLPGTRLGPYEVVAALGAGGMGEVYRAYDRRLERDVAVKILPEGLAGDSDALGRFEREAKALARLSHPAILSIHDVGREGSLSFVVTELLEGETLATRLERGAVPIEECLRVAIALAEGLTAAHGSGVVHRDLKPANVFLTSDGRVKILDFGLARRELGLLAGSAAPVLPDSPTLREQTVEGTLIGTVHYMSPEQAQGKRADARSDLFSLGAVVYEMVAGRRPFLGDNITAVLAAVLRDSPPPLTSLRGDCPPELGRVVVRAIEKDPPRRYQDAPALLADLREVARQLDPGLVSVAARKPPVSSRGARLWLWLGVTVVVVSVLAALAWRRPWRPSRWDIDSLAVLPFASIGGEPEGDYLGDGLTESLTNALSRLPELRVIGWSTMSRYRGDAGAPQRVGRELGVRAVLVGRIKQRGGELVVSSELVDLSDSSQLWGSQFPTSAAQLLRVQEEITAAVSARLRPRLSRRESELVAKRFTTSGEAYQSYLRGRYCWNRRTPDGFARAIELFSQAIVADPSYALAYAGLADCYLLLGASEYGAISPVEARQRAREAARKALEIDDAIAEPHATLGLLDWSFEWDWELGERELRRAIELNPSYATAYQWHAELAAAAGRFAEAKKEIAQAQRLDPLSLPVAVDIGMVSYYERAFGRAAAEYQQVVAMDPTFVQGHLGLGLACAQSGRGAEAVAAMEKAVALAGRAPATLAALGYALGRAGDAAAARKVLAELQGISASRYVSPYYLAAVLLGVGEAEPAFAWLFRACDERSSMLVTLKVEPAFDPLRGDPRFADLLRRVRVPGA